MNNATKLFIFVVASTFMGSSRVSTSNQEFTNIEEDGRCHWTVSLTLVYGDGKVIRVESKKDAVSSAVITQFNFSYFALLNDQTSYAGENGVTVQDEGHRILVFPGGYSGQQVVHLFNYTSSSTITIDVYCQPLGLAYRQGAILGYCTTNTTARAAPYFKLGVRNGKWTDVSRTGLYSDQLDTTNLTNAVILQYENDFDPLVTKLYFAEGSNIHEVDLGRQQADTHPSPDGKQIDRLVPAVNSSFPVLRVTFYNSGNPRYSHQYFSSGLESGFMNDIFNTDYVAFDSFDLSYLVTFANLNTLSVIRQDSTSQQFQLNITLDDPIQCHNMAIAPNVHYLICLADDGLHPVIINITEQVTCKIVPVFDLQIVQVGMLTKDTFYLLTVEREMLLYIINSVLMHLGRYALRRDINYLVTSATSDIVCTTSEPAHTAGNGLHLGIIIAVSFIVTILLLFVFMAAICRARSRQTTSQHSAALTTFRQAEELTWAETALDDYNKTWVNGNMDGTAHSLSVESVESNEHSVSTCDAIECHQPVEDTNGEHFSEKNPKDTTSYSDAVIEPLVVADPDHNVIPYISSVKCDDEIFEPNHNSSQPVPFEEAKPILVPVQSTKDQSSSVPVSDVER